MFKISVPSGTGVLVSASVIAVWSSSGFAQGRSSEDQAETRSAERSAIEQQEASELRSLPLDQAARADVRVIGGYDANRSGQWEFTANLTIAGAGRCGGVLVSPDIRGSGDARHVVNWRSGSTQNLWVLTAAHCVWKDAGELLEPDEIIVKIGVLDLQGIDPPTILAVQEIIAHADYQSDANFRNDIALLRLEQPTQGQVGKGKARSLRLPTLRDYQTLNRPGVRQQVNGWGITGDGNVTSFLQTADIPYLDQKACYDNYLSIYGELPDGAYCAGWLEGGVDSCGGDSGGPIFFPGGVGISPYTYDPILMGLVSWGRGCAEEGFPGIYTSVFHFIDWIEKEVAQRD